MLGIDHLHLETRDRRAEQRESPCAYRQVVGIVDLDRLGDALGLQHLPVDRVGHEPATAWREGSGDRDFCHAEGREDATSIEPEPLGLGDERVDRLRIDRLGTRQRERE